MGMEVYMGCFFCYTKGSDSQARTDHSYTRLQPTLPMLHDSSHIQLS